MVPLRTKANKKNTGLPYQVIAFMAIFVLVALCFFKWRTNTIYGDDLSIFKNSGKLSDYQSIVGSQKFRPVNTLVTKLLINLFGKNLSLFFYFNVAIQAIAAFIFMKVADLFLKSPLLSFIATLLVALSRFNLYNITQLYNGGALETLAMVFFLSALYYLFRCALTEPGKQDLKLILLSLLFANLCMYTHERYIIVFIFIILCMLTPIFKTIPLGRRMIAISIAVVFVAINYFIKTSVYHILFFMGTGNTGITFSPSSAARYFIDGLASIMQINLGPEYLVGAPFSSLTYEYKILVVLLFVYMIIILVLFIKHVFNKQPAFGQSNKTTFQITILLIAILCLCLGPAIVTIRLEQRWLQASAAIFILIVAIMINTIVAEKTTKAAVMVLFAIPFLLIDHHYLDSGAQNIYLCNAEKKAGTFHRAVVNGTIRSNSTELIICEKSRDQNSENELKWVLLDGTFFDYYQEHSKKISFIDMEEAGKLLLEQASEKNQYIVIDNEVRDTTNSHSTN